MVIYHHTKLTTNATPSKNKLATKDDAGNLNALAIVILWHLQQLPFSRTIEKVSIHSKLIQGSLALGQLISPPNGSRV